MVNSSDEFDLMAAVDALRRVCDDFTSLMFYYHQNVYHNTIFNLALPGPAGNLELLAEFAGVGLEGWGREKRNRKKGKGERRDEGKGKEEIVPLLVGMLVTPLNSEQ